MGIANHQLPQIDLVNAVVKPKATLLRIKVAKLVSNIMIAGYHC